jgi:uncharacterized RDD family membrane protein YckC
LYPNKNTHSNFVNEPERCKTSNKSGNTFIVTLDSIGWSLFSNLGCGAIHVKVEEKEIRRLPRLVMNLIMTLIFWIVSIFIPPTLEGLTIPGINTDASLLVWILTIIIMGIFLIRALSDALVLGDVLTDMLVKKLGVKEERSPKRAAREFAYIIIIVLIVTAVSPLLVTIQDFGYYLSTATVYIGLGLIILFIYDIGRIIYKIIEAKTESFTNHLSQRQKSKSSG